MLNLYYPTRPMRSNAFHSVVPHKQTSIKIGRRLCATATAVLWNSLPTDLRCEIIFVNLKKIILKLTCFSYLSCHILKITSSLNKICQREYFIITNTHLFLIFNNIYLHIQARYKILV